MKFEIYIKSHTAMSDYQGKCNASSKKEAAIKFSKLPSLLEWEPKDLISYIYRCKKNEKEI